MNERLIDVIDRNGTVLHTYPITLNESDHTTDAFDHPQYSAKALEAAAHGRLVADTELSTLTARQHIDRGGQMAPYGDDIERNSETKRALDEAVRERAYLLWETDGRPDGRAEEHWQRARDQHLRERAYVLWQQEGSPEGRQDEHWRRLVDFQAQ
ncbi:DUF2934 domain-containing protein [Caballeronia sp. GAWG1-5s-s]|uniref:DUF2934 domain-containing protein n=1 Tax=Caballeronia sp. GAWG1-5s-s TaxID=2921743 RepID=UPI0020282550|nr:DUF2934 domain-containing protein [Caballeronia sp. GAWG1-5s-s]